MSPDAPTEYVIRRTDPETGETFGTIARTIDDVAAYLNEYERAAPEDGSLHLNIDELAVMGQ